MSRSQIIPLLIYVVFVLAYLWFSTRFKKGWAGKAIVVKGGRLNVLLVIVILFVVLVVIVKKTM